MKLNELMPSVPRKASFPFNSGVSTCSTTSFIFLSPSDFTVAMWLGFLPIMLFTSSILSFTI